MYVNPANSGDHLIAPVVGWAVFRLAVHDFDTDEQLPKVRSLIEGVVLDGALAVSAVEWHEGFWWYLGPDDPDPKPGTEPQPPGTAGKNGDGKGKGRDGDGRGRRPPRYRFASAG